MSERAVVTTKNGSAIYVNGIEVVTFPQLTSVVESAVFSVTSGATGNTGPTGAIGPTGVGYFPSNYLTQGVLDGDFTVDSS